MITTLTEPQYFQPAYNSIVYTADSTSKAECKFEYIFDVYINGNFIIRETRHPTGTASLGVLDISKLVQDFVSFDTNENALGFKTNPNSICKVDIRVGEQYDTTIDCSSTVTIFANQVDANTIFVWNGALSYDEYQDYDMNTYIMNSNITNFLTKAPNNTRVGMDDKFNLNFLQIEGDTITQAEIRTYDQSMLLTGIHTIDNPYHGVLTTPMNMLTFGAGPTQLLSSTFSSFGSTQPIINDNTYYYSIQLFNASAPYSNVQFFEIDKRVVKYKPKRLWWLNTLGGFDSYTFIMDSGRNINISRTEFTKKLPFNYNIGDRGRTTLSVNAMEQYTYNSDWMTEAEGLWIENLFYSPEQYLVSIANTMSLSNSVCYGLEYPINSGVVHGTHIDLGITDGGVTLPNGTFFTYVSSGGGSIGLPSHGSGIITGYSGGLYHTNIPTSSPPSSALVTGTITLQPYIYLGLPYNAVSAGQGFSYCISPDTALCLNLDTHGFATFISFDEGLEMWKTDLQCFNPTACEFEGIIKLYNGDMKLHPQIVSIGNYEEKLTTKVKNILYTVTTENANKINIQRN